MSLSRSEIRVRLTANYYDKIIEVTYCHPGDKDEIVTFIEYATHAVILSGRIYYARDDEIWNFFTTSPFAFSRRICKTNKVITDLFIEKTSNSLCYRLKDEDKIFKCDLNPPDKMDQPGVIIRIEQLLYSCNPYPVSLSGRHYAFIKKNTMYFFELMPDDRLEILSFHNLQMKRHMCIVMLSHEHNTFMVVGEYEVKIFQFSKTKIDQINHIKFKVHDYNAWSNLYRGMSLQDNRYLLLIGKQIPYSTQHTLLLDLKEQSYRWLAQRSDRHYNPYKFAAFSSPYIILMSYQSIAVAHIKNINKQDFFKIPDLEFNFSYRYRLFNLVAWPYDQVHGQLCALTLEHHEKLKLILIKFKEGCALEKIRDIDTNDNLDPKTLFIANNLLFYQHIDKTKKESKDQADHYPTQSFTYNAETDTVSVIADDDAFARLEKTFMIGSHMGVFSGNNLQMFLKPYPESKKIQTETELLADSCHMFSMDIIRLIASYLSPAAFSLGRSTPPAEIKHSAKEKAVLDNLEIWLNKTKKDKFVYDALKHNKINLLFHRESYNVIASNAMRCTKIYNAKDKWLLTFRSKKVQNRCKVHQFLEEVSRCDVVEMPDFKTP